MTNTIGNNIREFRTKLGITQDELASYCGIQRTMISYFETGEREISLLHLDKIAEYMNIDMDAFLKENTNEIKPDLALAFRANELSASDRESIASFKSIVKNYIKMKKIEADGVET
jgi:transcriptional regulator with XRE-family HTH domain